MIGKAKAIPHGHANLAYIMGESKRKEHAKEKIQFVTSHGLDPLCRSREAWEEIQLACRENKRMTHTVIQVIISPDKKDAEGYTTADWRRLWEEYVEAFDTLDHRNERGKLISQPTNLRGSLHTVWVHYDSESGTPHLHAAVCRVDSDGNTNPDGNIHLRAQAAAEVINLRRGWESPMAIREKQLRRIKEQCMAILKAMPQYSLDVFHARLRDAGYEVLVKKDSKGVVHGHSLRKGNCHYKMSEVGREFTVSRLGDTWAKLHTAQMQSKPTAVPKPSSPMMPDYTQPAANRVRYDVAHCGMSRAFYIPEPVLDIFREEYDDWQIANDDEMIHTAVAIFVGLLLPADVPSSVGGGGSSNDKDWGRDPKEDEREWARRCARLAQLFAKPTPRRRRGR